MRLELGAPTQLLLALGPDLVLMVGAMLLLLWAAWRPDSVEHQRRVGIGSAVLVVLTAAAVIYYLRQGWTVGLGPVAMDPFRWVADLIFLVGALLTIALSIDYNARQGIAAAEMHILVLLATAGMMLLAAARDLMLIFLGIELMSISSYALAAIDRRSIRGAEGALKYFLLGAFSTAFLLYGIALVYGATGATNLTEIWLRTLEFDLLANPLLVIGIALLLVGFGFKVAAAPFHMWAPDVYEGAPTPITGFMAAAVKAGAFAAFLRIWMEAFPAVVDGWHAPVVGLAIVTMIVGNVIALAQRNIKRLLAYSSIAHAGYVLVTVAIGTPLASGAFLFYLLAYTLATMGAFGVVVALGNVGERNLHLDDYAGLWSVRPWLAAAMGVFMLALLGFPVFGGMGFLAKWYILEAALRAPSPETTLAIVLVLTSVISAGYYLYVVMVMFMRPRAAEAPLPGRVGGATTGVVLATALLILVLGLYPDPVVQLARRSAPQPPDVMTAVPALPAVPPR